MDTKRRDSFDGIPDLYARARPGYPEALFDHICRFAGVGAGSRALEIGCGPGTATVPMAARGLVITAVELSPHMAAYAERATAGRNVCIHCAAFEDWPLSTQPFDLVYAGSSFHWVQPEVRCVKAAAALRQGGTLALFWNRQVRAKSDDRFFDALQAIYAGEAPELLDRYECLSHPQRMRTEYVGEIQASGLFGSVTAIQMSRQLDFTGETYTALLSTYSDHATLDPQQRDELLNAIRRLIDERFGGRITREWVTVLFMAKRS